MGGDDNHYPALSHRLIARFEWAGNDEEEMGEFSCRCSHTCLQLQEGTLCLSDLGLVWLLGICCCKIPLRKREDIQLTRMGKHCDSVTSVIWARQFKSNKHPNEAKILPLSTMLNDSHHCFGLWNCASHSKCKCFCNFISVFCFHRIIMMTTSKRHFKHSLIPNLFPTYLLSGCHSSRQLGPGENNFPALVECTNALGR